MWISGESIIWGAGDVGVVVVVFIAVMGKADDINGDCDCCDCCDAFCDET